MIPASTVNIWGRYIFLKKRRYSTRNGINSSSSEIERCITAIFSHAMFVCMLCHKY